MCFPVRFALWGEGSSTGTVKLPAVAESLYPCRRSSPPRAAVAAPRQSEAAAPLAEAGPREGTGSERRLQRFGENEA